MKVCTFLGDPFRIYDEVTQRIEEALEEILAAHGEMELYFPGWFGEFPRACAAAALRVKGRHPDRIVTLTLAVSAQWQEEPAACCVLTGSSVSRCWRTAPIWAVTGCSRLSYAGATA